MPERHLKRVLLTGTLSAESIMASGHEQCRINRPNTWQLRPAVRNRSKNPCQHGAVHTWHLPDVSSLRSQCPLLRVKQTFNAALNEVTGIMTRRLFVNGTLMRGLPLHSNLEGAVFLSQARTAPLYRLYSIDDVHPGMFAVETGGISVAGEIYEMDDDVWARVEAGEPPGLYCGPVTLEDARIVDGILYPRELAQGRHKDISHHGGWRAYMAAMSAHGA